jgi:hypothetical protein
VRQDEDYVTSTDLKAQFDLNAECETSWSRLKPACQDHTQFSKVQNTEKNFISHLELHAGLFIKLQKSKIFLFPY